MQVFLEEKLILFAIPKTGSTALEAATRARSAIELRHRSGLRHLTIGEYQKKWAPFLKRIYGFEGEGFAIIRDPLERLGSHFRYRLRLDPASNPRSTQGMSFEAFLEQDLSGDVEFGKVIGNQHNFLTDTEGNVGVTHLFSYDVFDKAVSFLSDRLGKPLTVKRLNVSPSAELDVSLDLVARIRETRAEEFALYDQVSRDGYLWFPPPNSE